MTTTAREARPWVKLADGSGIPRTALVLFSALAAITVAASLVVLFGPGFTSPVFGSLTPQVVVASGFADGFNPCAYALLVLFATYTLTLVNAVTADGRATASARRTLLGAGSLYVGAIFVTYFLLGLGLYTLVEGLGKDHIVARAGAVLALVMALWMLKDVFLPGFGPAMAAPSGTHGLMNRAMQRGGLAGMLLAGVLVGFCTVPCSGAMYFSVTAVLHASGGGIVGLALLALYNVAFILPLLLFLLFVSNRRVLGTIGRWNRKNGAVVKTVLAVGVIAMSFGLLISLGGTMS